MARSLLVAPAAENVNLARTCLGLLRALDRRGVNVAFVKPVAQLRADGGPDRSAALVTAISALRPPEPMTTAELEQQLGEGELDVVLDKIVAAWEPIYERSDVVVVEGLRAGPSALYASSLNQALARALDADVLLADVWPADGDAEGLAEQLAIAAGGYVSGEQARVVGCVVHGLPGADAAAAGGPGKFGTAVAGLRAALAKRKLRLIAGVPHRPELTWPRVRDLVHELHPEILHEGNLSRRIKDVAVMAQGIPGGIHALDTGRLVVVPGDRHEVIMAAYLAELSGAHLAALLLSAGTAPDPQVSQLTRATAAVGLPVLLVEPRQLPDRDPGAGPGPGPARRRHRTDRGRDEQYRRRARPVVAGVADQHVTGRAGSAPPRSVTSWSNWPVPPTRSSSCPKATSRASCGPRSRARNAASPAACCWARPTRWPRRPGTSGCGCPAASPSWTREPSPSAMSSR